MREIKYRAWDKNSNRMFDVVEMMWEDGVFSAWREPYKNEKVSWIKSGLEIGKECELMQYTGIKDKNGKEIYEGDILSTDLSRPYLFVEYKNGAFMYQCYDDGEDYYDFMLPSYAESYHDYYSEVIGNIYENPELVNA